MIKMITCSNQIKIYLNNQHNKNKSKTIIIKMIHNLRNRTQTIMNKIKVKFKTNHQIKMIKTNWKRTKKSRIILKIQVKLIKNKINKWIIQNKKILTNKKINHNHLIKILILNKIKKELIKNKRVKFQN